MEWRITIDNQILRLIIPVPPSVNHYLSYRAIMKNRKPMAMSYKTPEAVKYQKELIKYIQSEVEKQNWVMSENKFQHYYMDCDFYFNRTDMDANNYFKIPADSITDSKCVWIDDTQLCERVNSIHYDTINPRIELVIFPVNYIGIFSDVPQLESFKSNCIQCSRYKNGKCSLLTKAIEGRIQPEIVSSVCNSYKNKNLKENT